jgi:hypothetical protein
MDVLESSVTVKAKLRETWPFVTDIAKMAMWSSPVVEPIAEGAARALDEGETFDLRLPLPGQPPLRCVMLSLNDAAVEVKFDGFARGLATWRMLPAGRCVIVHARVKYELADRRWLVPWTLAGRWGAALSLAWLMRRLKARVEDTVGSSRFGVPLLVSPYALASVATAVGAGLGLVGLCAARCCRWRKGRCT